YANPITAHCFLLRLMRVGIGVHDERIGRRRNASHQAVNECLSYLADRFAHVCKTEYSAQCSPLPREHSSPSGLILLCLAKQDRGGECWPVISRYNQHPPFPRLRRFFIARPQGTAFE